MRKRFPRRALGSLLSFVAISGLASGQAWTNLGGGAGRNGWIDDCGPTDGRTAWTRKDFPSVIAWQPFVAEKAVFVVRQTGFPQMGGSARDRIQVLDLATGVERWGRSLSYGGDPTVEWTSWIGGIHDGRVLVARSTQGMPGPLKALSVDDGSLLWTSTFSTEAWAHDGVVLAPNGDWIVGDAMSIRRVRASDGALVWEAPRLCSVSGACGVALSATGVFFDEPDVGGNRIVKLDPSTGARLYTSPVMPGSTSHNTPFLSHAGDVVYFAQTEDSPATDRLYAFHDQGVGLAPIWSRSVRWTINHGHGVASDESIYTFLPNDEFVRLDPMTGVVADSAGVLSPVNQTGFSPKTAVDHHGRVYVSNGWIGTPGTNGRLWAFSADLARTHFIVALEKPNAGGPAVGGGGYLVLADVSEVRAYKTVYRSSETVRLGVPPNPNAFRPARTSPPRVGQVWDPWVDHTSFAPDSVLDFLALSFDGEMPNVSLAAGTLLCTPPPLSSSSLPAR